MTKSLSERVPWNERLSLGKRMMMTLFLTLLLLGLLTAGSLLPMTTEEAQSLLEEFEKLFQGRLGIIEIFLNNLTVTLIAFIPFVGPFIAGFIIFQTGRVFGAVAASTGIPAAFLILLAIIAVYGILEFMAYGVAFSENIILSYSILRKSMRSELRWLLLSIFMSASLLLLAATIEFILIQHFSGI